LMAANKSVLYASVHPSEHDSFEDLCNAVDRLALNDIGLQVHTMASSSSGSDSGGPFLGPGLRVGFQGLLHVEVFRQRLMDEFGIQAVVTPPKVPYTITFLPGKGKGNEEAYTKVVEDLSDWPEFGQRYNVLEPIVDARIVARVEDVGAIMELLTRKRATNLETVPVDETKWLFTARMPWGEVVTDFHDHLKNVTAGYGSLDTSEADPPFAEADLHKVEIMLNGEVVEPLSFVCHRDVMQGQGASVCKKVSETIACRSDGKPSSHSSCLSHLVASCSTSPAICHCHSSQGFWQNYF
jgi:GTP-binding protein LepA